MCFQGGFSVGAENVDGLQDLLVHILNELFDWFRENVAFGGGEGAMVASEVLYSLRALCLLEFAVVCIRRRSIRGKRGVMFTSRDDAGSNRVGKPFSLRVQLLLLE